MAKKPRPRAVDDPRRLLTLAVEKAGSARAFAGQSGISEQYVCDVRAGRRAAGPAMLLALGLVRVVTYVPQAGDRS